MRGGIGNEQFCEDFLRGARDCLNGRPHRDGSDAYNRGYSSQYAYEQHMTAQSEYWENLVKGRK